MDDADEQRLWILSQSVRDSLELDHILSHMFILANVYKLKTSGNDKILPDIKNIINEMIAIRTFKKTRSQKLINELKIKVDTILAKIISNLNPKNMVDYSPFEARG